jgi:hypothetical protein
MSELIGLEVGAAKKLLAEKGVDFRLSFYNFDKFSGEDMQLVIAARGQNPAELIVGNFKFHPEVSE